MRLWQRHFQMTKCSTPSIRLHEKLALREHADDASTRAQHSDKGRSPEPLQLDADVL